MLTTRKVEKMVRELRKMTDDPEGAHGAEDALHMCVLQAIAEGDADDPRSIAKAALKTREISFPRWCA